MLEACLKPFKQGGKPILYVVKYMAGLRANGNCAAVFIFTIFAVQ